MKSFNIEDLKNLKINLTHDVAEGVNISSNVSYDIANPEEVSIHSSKGDISIPLFSHADVKVNLYKEEEDLGNFPSMTSKQPTRCPSIQSIRNILQISDDELEPNDSYYRSIRIIRKLDDIVNKMKIFTETAKRKLRMNNYKKDNEKVFKKYLDESQDLFEELRTYHSNKRTRTSKSRRSQARSHYTDSSESDRSPSPKRYRYDAKIHGHSSKYNDKETSVHNKSSQSRKFTDKNRSNRATSVDSISSINSGNEDELRDHNNKSRHDRSFDRHSRNRHSNRNHRFSNFGYDQYSSESSTAKEIERYYRYSYYAVMYAFPIIMDMLRQENVTF